ncbi:tyrosine-type recombinase/integrase [Marinobacter salarius]|jgi:site-specific recombinase XerD|uniref:tyrosine-type recombinase/integrase n=1 Tax=Marinobacter salarius TaxID=1420917 RepID=UPI001D18A0E7|nr:tyrosine-type recombinase/integrase [Marinobacter salarius]
MAWACFWGIFHVCLPTLSFAVHLLLHGRPLKFVSQLLGHRSVESTEVYTNVLTFDGAHLLEGVEFH